MREQWQRRVAQIGAMVDGAKARGVSGWVQPGAAPIDKKEGPPLGDGLMRHPRFNRGNSGKTSLNPPEKSPEVSEKAAEETEEAAEDAITPEQAESRKWKKNDDGTYTSPNGTVWKKAKAGGEESPVTGEFFKGGSLMPIHGLAQKPPKMEGDGKGTASEAKPKEDKEGKEGGKAIEPMSPEMAERERERRERQRKWDEMNAGPLGQITWMGDRPNSKGGSGVPIDKWVDYASKIGSQGVQTLISELEPIVHRSIEKSWQEAVSKGAKDPGDAGQWEKDQLHERANYIKKFNNASKRLEKAAPGAHYARELIEDLLSQGGGDREENLYRVHQLLSDVAKKPAESAPDKLPERKKVKVRKSPTRSTSGVTIAREIISRGGITPSSLEGIIGAGKIGEEGLLGVASKQGRPLDEIAQTLEKEGHFVTPPGRNSDDYLVELLQRGYHSMVNAANHLHAEVEKEYDDYLRQAHEAGIAASDIDEATRSGEAEGNAEAARGDAWEGVGVLANEAGLDFDTSEFDAPSTPKDQATSDFFTSPPVQGNLLNDNGGDWVKPLTNGGKAKPLYVPNSDTPTRTKEEIDGKSAIQRSMEEKEAALADYPELAPQSNASQPLTPAASGEEGKAGDSKDAKTPAAAKSGPKEGDRNAEGLVFRNGRWQRDGEDDDVQEIQMEIGSPEEAATPQVAPEPPKPKQPWEQTRGEFKKAATAPTMPEKAAEGGMVEGGKSEWMPKSDDRRVRRITETKISKDDVETREKLKADGWKYAPGSQTWYKIGFYPDAPGEHTYHVAAIPQNPNKVVGNAAMALRREAEAKAREYTDGLQLPETHKTVVPHKHDGRYAGTPMVDSVSVIRKQQ